tara:strand:+ start:1323 stop:1595 length:273 start_codon:yes stop_codon:yes gene_type:complete
LKKGYYGVGDTMVFDTTDMTLWKISLNPKRIQELLEEILQVNYKGTYEDMRQYTQNLEDAYHDDFDELSPFMDWFDENYDKIYGYDELFE